MFYIRSLIHHTKLVFKRRVFMKAHFLQEDEKQKDSFSAYNVNELGLTWSPQQCSFRIWAPTANRAQLKLYKLSLGGEPLQTIELTKR